MPEELTIPEQTLRNIRVARATNRIWKELELRPYEKLLLDNIKDDKTLEWLGNAPLEDVLAWLKKIQEPKSEAPVIDIKLASVKKVAKSRKP